MKCPKCSYLGFETGDRCKNCGYDFSLMGTPAHGDSSADGGFAEHQWDDLNRLVEQPAMSDKVADPLGAMPLDTVVALPAVAAVATAAKRVDVARGVARPAVPSLPLFQPGADQDEPLIKLLAAPRPPLAVRRTPDKPRPRSVPKPVRRVAAEATIAPVAAEPSLRFLDEASPGFSPGRDSVAAPATTVRPIAETSGAPRRLVAAAIDHGILLAIDAVVIYLTFKMAALAPGEWRMLPPVPLAAFLGMVKVAYFCAFTLVGGQTIGKMAVRIRVVGDDGAELDPAQAMQRTLAGALSLLAAGLGFLPVLLTDDRRAVHDRVARTRVIALPSR